jgi:hypothetical protein
MFVFAIVCLLVLSVFISCSDKEVEFEPAPFTLNAERVDAPLQVPELNLEFSPPLGWNMLDSAALDNFRKMLGGTDLSREFYPVFPLMVFSDSATGGVMYFAEIEESEADLSQIAKRYEDFLVPRLSTSAMTPSHYLINELKVYHYLLHSENVVNYKLLGETTEKKRFLIEFIVGAATYPQLEPSISSALSSIKPIPAPQDNE